MSATVETVGDVFNRRGPCALMEAVVRLVEKRQRIPVGFWDLELETGWRLQVNGTAADRSGIPPWHAMVSHDGLPLVLFDTVDGTQLGGEDQDGRTPEDRCLEVLERAIQL